MGRWFDSVPYWTYPVFCTVVARLCVARVDINQAGYSVDSNNLGSRKTPPQISWKVGNQWENITGKVGSPPAGIHSLYSHKGDDFLLSCTAQYPIQWTISGTIVPPEVVKIQPPKRDLKKKTFLIEVNIFFLDAENFTDLAASAVISCHEVQNAKNRDEIAVFVKGNSDKSLLAPVETTLEGKVSLIPCPTTDPATLPTLYYNSGIDQPETAVENVIYYPNKGFQYASADTKLFNGGIYTCRKDSQSVTITILDSSSAADTHFMPATTIVRRFSDEQIEFKCSSKTKPATLVFDQSSDTEVTKITDLEKSKYFKLALAKSSAQLPKVNGKATCSISGGESHEWHWEFLQPPQLYIDNHEVEADCLSSFTPKIAQSVRCKNSMDCDFMGKSCLQNVTLCNFKKQKQFFAEMDTHCWVEELKKGLECTSLPFSHLNGIVQCDVLGLVKQWEFFISLDYKRYSNWKDVPLRELVRIEDYYEDDYDSTTATESTKLVCKAAAYLFADSIAFEIQYKNGTTSLIQQDKHTGSPSPHSGRTREILELYVQATLDKKMLSKDAVAIDCLAPFWNSTEVLKASKFLGDRRMSAMMVSKEGEPLLLQKSEPQVSDQTFYIGETNKRLNCTDGDITQDSLAWIWLYRESDTTGSYKNVSKVFPTLRVADETDQTYLEFPQVEKKHAGLYECVIMRSVDNVDTIDSNDITMVLTKYKLNVNAEPLPTSTTVFVGITILVLVISGLAIAGFAVFLQKRNA